MYGAPVSWAIRATVNQSRSKLVCVMGEGWPSGRVKPVRLEPDDRAGVVSEAGREKEAGYREASAQLRRSLIYNSFYLCARGKSGAGF
jgi:hypothetical protein